MDDHHAARKAGGDRLQAADLRFAKDSDRRNEKLFFEWARPLGSKGDDQQNIITHTSEEKEDFGFEHLPGLARQKKQILRGHREAHQGGQRNFYSRYAMIDPIAENKGRRVVLSEKGEAISPRKVGVVATIVGFSKDCTCCRVQWDGTKYSGSYHLSFLRFATEEDEEKSENYFRELRQRELEKPEVAPDPVPLENLPNDKRALADHAETRKDFAGQSEVVRPSLENPEAKPSKEDLFEVEQMMTQALETKSAKTAERYNDALYKHQQPKGGRIVRHRGNEKFGRTKNSDMNIPGKVMVYMDDGRKLLVAHELIEYIGFWD